MAFVGSWVMNVSSPLSSSSGEKPWQTTLIVMFTAQLLSIIGFAFVLPFIPFFVRELGVADERLVPVWAGNMAAASAFTMAVFSPLWGWLADRYGRRIMVERAMFGGAVITFAMGFVGNVWQLLFLRILSGAMTGTVGAATAMVSTAVPKDKLGFSLGLMQVAVFLGMTLGPWIGGLLADAVGFRNTCMAGGIIILAGGLLVLFGTKERFVRPSDKTLRENGGFLSILSYAGIPAMLALFFVFQFTVQFVVPILPLFVESLYGPDRSNVASTTGMLLALSGGTSALAAALIGIFSDRIGHKRLLAIHMGLTALCMFLHGMAQGIWQLAGVRILYGVAVGGILPVMNALVGCLIPSNRYGTAYGLTSSMASLGMACGPLCSGYMASWWGYRTPFLIIGSFITLISVPIIGLGFRTKETTAPVHPEGSPSPSPRHES